MERLDGRCADVACLADEIAAHYSSGYLFQALAAPHPEIARLCGPRLATVRMLTLLTEAGPQLFRAAWKIPTGGHAADNFWRPGNLLAALDLADGRVRRAVSGAGVDGREIAVHPANGVMLPGLQQPECRGVLDADFKHLVAYQRKQAAAEHLAGKAAIRKL